MNFIGSKTEKNLYTAFTGEAHAHLKYLFYSEIAKNDGYEQIAELFEYTAKNEQEHAKLWFKALELLGSTKENLEDARSGENFEHTKLYKEFAQEAKDEGFMDIAKLFEGVGKIEKEHEQRFIALIDNINNEAVFNKKSTVKWQCRNCGHIYEGKASPKKCPICSYEESYFQIYPENY